MAGRHTLPALQHAGYHFGSDYLTIFGNVYLDNKPIGVICVQYDLAELNSRMLSYSGIAIIIVLTVAGLALFMSSRLQRVISMPILSLAKTAKLISQDKRYSLRAEKYGQDEIGALIDGFNEMLSEIQLRDAELERQRVLLEVQVEERTAELSGANEELLAEIQERTRAEEALRVAEKTFRNLLETIQLVAILLDCEGNVTFCNDYLLNLTDWGKEELLGRNWFDLFIPDNKREKAKMAFSSVIKGKREVLYSEDSIVTRRGSERLISWNNAVLHDLEGKVAGTASIGIDITEQKNLEAQLRQAQKMEAVGQLAGGVAHDFNNILQAIMGYGSLLLMKMNGDATMRHCVDQILDASNKAAGVTRSLLAFSRKQIMNPRPVDLNDIVRGIEKLLSRLISEDIEITISLTNKNVLCVADAGQIEQVLMNLTTNARDAMPKGGRLIIETEAIDLDDAFIRSHGYGKRGRFALLTVSDTGIGLKQDEIEKIFDPFYTTKETGKGTGLGLAMAYGIVQQHGGYINVYSELDQGTTFRIYLPAAQIKEEIAIASSAEPPPVGGSETILVVEDDEMLRELSKTVLTENGYKVILARDGQEAVEKFIDHRDAIQLAIIDMIMPKKNGKEAYSEMIKIRSDIKVLFASGYTSERIDALSLSKEELHFINKPVSPKQLLRKVREILDIC
jgi:PAS domain S-box-containing protein